MSVSLRAEMFRASVSGKRRLEPKLPELKKGNVKKVLGTIHNGNVQNRSYLQTNQLSSFSYIYTTYSVFLVKLNFKR